MAKHSVLCAYLFISVAQAQVAPQAIGILQKRCGGCHGESSATSGLKVTSREDLLHGGSKGAAVVPGHASDSLLYQAVARTGKLAMPPGPALPGSEVAVLQNWIDHGAEWPTTLGKIEVQKSDWWAFQKVRHPHPPAATANPIDAFIQQKLQENGVEASPRASKLALIKRASYDLTGLPPTQEQISQFLADTSPNAWEHVIDTLLASPRYGEKWGRHWLDLARYGDTAGFEQDPYILEAWRYRDYVIKSFNDDKPYDRFVKEQIAGDELYPDDPEAKTGTGFYRVGTNRDMLFKVEDQNAFEKLTDAVDTTSAVFLGLTVGCARCHDHKFDPIPQRDYYRMQAIFMPAVSTRIALDYNPAHFYDIQQNYRDFRLRQIGAQIARILQPYKDKLREQKIARLPDPVRAAEQTKEEARTPEQRTLVAQNKDSITVSDDELWALLSPGDAERIQTISRKLVSNFDGYGPPPVSLGITDVGREAPRTYIAIRGNFEAPGDEVQPGFLSVLGGGDVPEPPLHARSTFRRRALAEWIARPENPMFARVMVNRIWQFHFGSGLVRTPSDFGTRAGQPSNPELLDWLACQFIDNKWSVKQMHKLIMLSDAYQRSANPTASADAKDPANTLLSHFSRRRLDADEIRDAVLEVAGNLNLKMEGSPVVPPLAPDEMFGMIGKPENNWVVTPDPAEHNRRSIYMLVRRTFQQPMLEAFDSPDGVLTCPRRNESTTAPQSLALLNGRFVLEESRSLAAKIKGPDDAWNRIYGRAPSPAERAAADEFLTKQTKLLGSREAAYSELVRGLLNTNEFLYVD